MEPQDTGDVAEVDETDRLDVDDDHPDEIAGDRPDLGDVYDDPGQVVEEDLT